MFLYFWCEKTILENEIIKMQSDQSYKLVCFKISGNTLLGKSIQILKYFVNKSIPLLD